LGHHAGGDRQLPFGADDYDVQVMLHSDTLNESGFVEDTVRLQGPHHPRLPHRRRRRRPSADIIKIAA
jgi:Urea amidohydrolase (urease) alpha subunit